MLEITVTVKRGTTAADSKTYKLDESGKSKKGTFKTFSPPAENEDLPAFSKLYVKVKRGK